jgi:hypothetical protein
MTLSAALQLVVDDLAAQVHVAHAACDGRSAVERRRDEATLARHAARTRAHAARVAAGGGR